ncbi:MAG: pectate lyase, partial [Bacillota bacterium]|nr:pectate lyase [Bacillota bacterium]
VTIKNCTFNKGEDKIFQVNKSSTWNITNCTVNGAGKVLRQNGGKKFPLTVKIDGLKATGVKEAIVRSDDPTCKVSYRNITCNLPKDKWFYGKFKATTF